jgi:Tol biopolymer transport system component
VFSADTGSGFRLYTIKPNGSGLRQLTDLDNNPLAADWSPDGRRIALGIGTEGHDGIAIINADGSHLRKIVPYRYEVAIKHDWAPDGRHIVITINADYPEGRSPNVATVRPDGSHLRLLTHFSDGQRGAFAGS